MFSHVSSTLNINSPTVIPLEIFRKRKGLWFLSVSIVKLTRHSLSFFLILLVALLPLIHLRSNTPAALEQIATHLLRLRAAQRRLSPRNTRRQFPSFLSRDKMSTPSWSDLLTELNRDISRDQPKDVVQWGADWFFARLKRDVSLFLVTSLSNALCMLIHAPACRPIAVWAHQAGSAWISRSVRSASSIRIGRTRTLTFL